MKFAMKMITLLVFAMMLALLCHLLTTDATSIRNIRAVGCNMDCKAKGNKAEMKKPYCHCDYCNNTQYYDDFQCKSFLPVYYKELCSYNHTFGEKDWVFYWSCDIGKCKTYGEKGALGICCDGRNNNPSCSTKPINPTLKPVPSATTEGTPTTEPFTQPVVNRINPTPPSINATGNDTSVLGQADDATMVIVAVIIAVIAGIGGAAVLLYCICCKKSKLNCCNTNANFQSPYLPREDETPDGDEAGSLVQSHEDDVAYNYDDTSV